MEVVEDKRYKKLSISLPVVVGTPSSSSSSRYVVMWLEVYTSDVLWNNITKGDEYYRLSLGDFLIGSCSIPTCNIRL
jgi:hypothetical protein